MKRLVRSIGFVALVACGRSPLDLPAVPTVGGSGGSTGHGGPGGSPATGAAGTIGGAAGSASDAGAFGGFAGGGGAIFVTGGGGSGGGGSGGGGSGGGSGTGGRRDAGVDAPVIGSKPIGLQCASSSECLSGVCANGVCCVSRCEGLCLSCAVPGSVGLCAPVPAGTFCVQPGCSGNSSSPGFTCDGKGTCPVVPLPPRPCAPFACNADKGTCYTTCASDDECFNTKCVNGSCGLIPIGARCTSGTECASGFCSDGQCCNVACQGACVSCALPGSIGKCTPTAVSVADPRAICKDQGPATCGTNGRCDGNGGCQRYAPGTACAQVECVGRTYFHGECNGLQTCVTSYSECQPYVCLADTSGCHTNCHGGDADCAPGYYCAGGELCMSKKPPGEQCSRNPECISNVCNSAFTCGPL